MRRLLDARDARGAKLYSDARQGVTFAMADALCGLSAAHSMARDSVSLVESARPDANVLIFLDLSLLASASAALATAEACAGLLYGYADRFPVSAEAESAFEALRAGLQESLDGTGAARTRVACFLRSGNAERQIVF